MAYPSWVIERLTHSASELARFTWTSSLTMNEKFLIPREDLPGAVLKISSLLLANEYK